ncbi:MAG: VanZ family protein [Lachnospiraceae bacterium]|nr:VanZ family protein [Lachnospiraceae bacterium]
MRKTVFLVLAVLWASVIFSFSAKNGGESINESRRAGKLICSIFVQGYNELTEERQYEMAGKIDYPVRKTAHAAEYAVLGLLIAGAVYDSRNKRIYNVMTPYVTGTIYAATDEIHQYFVPGRSCRLTDVFIDSAGVLAGIIIVCVIIMLHHKLPVLRR